MLYPYTVVNKNHNSICAGLILLLSIFAPLLHAEDRAELEWEIFPHGHLFQPLTADSKEPLFR